MFTKQAKREPVGVRACRQRGKALAGRDAGGTCCSTRKSVAAQRRQQPARTCYHVRNAARANRGERLVMAPLV